MKHAGYDVDGPDSEPDEVPLGIPGVLYDVTLPQPQRSNKEIDEALPLDVVVFEDKAPEFLPSLHRDRFFSKPHVMEICGGIGSSSRVAHGKGLRVGRNIEIPHGFDFYHGTVFRWLSTPPLLAGSAELPSGRSLRP